MSNTMPDKVRVKRAPAAVDETVDFNESVVDVRNIIDALPSGCDTKRWRYHWLSTDETVYPPIIRHALDTGAMAPVTYQNHGPHDDPNVVAKHGLQSGIAQSRFNDKGKYVIGDAILCYCKPETHARLTETGRRFPTETEALKDTFREPATGGSAEERKAAIALKKAFPGIKQSVSYATGDQESGLAEPKSPFRR